MRNSFGLHSICPSLPTHIAAAGNLQESNRAKIHWLNGTTVLPEHSAFGWRKTVVRVSHAQTRVTLNLLYLLGFQVSPSTLYQAYNGNNSICSFIDQYSNHLLNNTVLVPAGARGNETASMDINKSQSNGEEDNPRTICKPSDRIAASNPEGRGKRYWQRLVGKPMPALNLVPEISEIYRDQNIFTRRWKSLCFKEITSQANLFHKHPQFQLENGLQNVIFLYIYIIKFCTFAFTSSCTNKTMNPVHKIGISQLPKLWFRKHPFPARLNKVLADAGSHPPAKAIIHVGCGVWTDFK